MTAIEDQATFAQDPTMYGGLRAAIVTAAISILNEDAGTLHHAERVALAKVVLRSPQQITETFAWAMASNAVVVNQWVAGDHTGAYSNFDYVVATVWDAVAIAWAG